MARRRAGSTKDAAASRARLTGYEAKRDFAATPEPAPGGSSEDDQRFVIHEHHASHLHWDLRLERDGALACWALPRGLPLAPGENHFAAATEDHPVEYLEFHGEIPQGNYGAGQMTIWDAGTYECLKWEQRKVEVMLHGERLQARYALFPIDEGREPKQWMIHRMDPPAEPDLEPMPERLVPMLAASGELPVPERGWAFEIKWDGVRAIAYSTPGRLRLESRNLNDITDSYPELARGAWTLGSSSAVLDGEIVAFGEHGRPSFGRLQQRMHVNSRAQARRLAASNPVTYVAFDLLWLDGHSLIGLPYAERRARLMGLELTSEGWQTPEHLLKDGPGLLQLTVEQGLEGVLAKRLSATYRPGVRSRDWIKIKSVARQEVVIGGWMTGKGKRSRTIGALLMGVHEHDGGLRYIGRVGSGFSDRELERLERLLAPLARETSPFQSGERPPREAQFCEPEIVAEVQFAEWTATGSLRQPSYKGTREDKPAAEVVREREPGASTQRAPVAGAARLALEETSAKGALAHVEGHELKLSNLEKVLYPDSGFTKRRLIEYYAAIAPVLLAHLQGRPLTVTRWPDGVTGKSFFQKQSPAHRPEWVRTATVASERKPIDYTLAEDLSTLIWLANLASIELHTPLARSPAMDVPTALVFDLDPGVPATVIECCRVALQLHGMFEQLGLQCFAKTSGSKGLQIYVPLNGQATYAQTKPFARTVAELLEQAEGDLVVSRMTKAKRAGKVLIDWSQNDAKKTTVCVYSLRATAEPNASTPLEWSEVRDALDSGDPGNLAFRADEAIARVAARGDLFAPVLSLVQALPSG